MAMSNQWKYQVRIHMDDEFAEVARRNNNDPAIKPLADILSNHNAAIKCQLDAFAAYVAEAEKFGTENYPLYKWTKATIEDPDKKSKHIKSFALYVDGDEVYTKQKADALEENLRSLIHSGLVTRISKHDTNPANNPQPPALYRK
jgi:hypothetical protein